MHLLNIVSEELFHPSPKKGPPRRDLRKPRILDDPDINDDPDMKVSYQDDAIKYLLSEPAHGIYTWPPTKT